MEGQVLICVLLIRAVLFVLQLSLGLACGTLLVFALVFLLLMDLVYEIARAVRHVAFTLPSVSEMGFPVTISEEGGWNS